MINEETKRKLRLLNIGEFIESYEEQVRDKKALTLSFDDRFQMMVDTVYQKKYNDKVEGLIKRAKLRLPKADIHDVFYHEQRPINRGMIDEVASGQYIDSCESIILQGYASTGKTFLGCAFAKEACRQLHRARYIRVPDLLTEYNDKSVLPGGKEKVLRKYSGFKVLVLDEWLLDDLRKDEVGFLFELSERRFDTTSTIFCTLYSTEDWIKRLGSGAYAESIVERYEHNSICIETGSMNMRDIFKNSRQNVSNKVTVAGRSSLGDRILPSNISRAIAASSAIEIGLLAYELALNNDQFVLISGSAAPNALQSTL